MTNPFTRAIPRRSLVATAAAVPVLGSLAACGGDESPPAGGGGGGGTVTFLYMGDASQQKQWQAVFDEFAKLHPDITLEAQGIATNSNWADFFNQVTSRLAGGDPPDMVQVATEGQRMFASKGLLAPLDDFIAQDQEVIDGYYGDMNQNLIQWNEQYGSPDGQTYYLPGDFNTMCMWCREDMFTEAGVELPGEDDDWSWDEFYAAAQAINKASGAYMYTADARYFASIMPWLLTNGASSFDAEWANPTMNSPEAVEAAEFCRKLIVDGLSPEPGGTFDEPTALAQGNLAVLGRGRWGVVDLQGVDAVDLVKIRKWPVKVGNGSPVGWNGYPILKDSKNKEAAWEFVKFLISKEGSSFFAELGGTIVPARESVASSDSFLEGAPEGTPLLYDALSYATPIPSPDRGAEIQKDVEDTWTQILTGNAEAQGALDELNDRLADMV